MTFGTTCMTAGTTHDSPGTTHGQIVTAHTKYKSLPYLGLVQWHAVYIDSDHNCTSSHCITTSAVLYNAMCVCLEMYDDTPLFTNKDVLYSFIFVLHMDR